MEEEEITRKQIHHKYKNLLMDHGCNLQVE